MSKRWNVIPERHNLQSGINRVQDFEMDRLRKIFQRYGWHLPFTILAIAVVRLTRIWHRAFLSWLRLTTHGHKGRHIKFGPDINVTPGCWLELGENISIEARCIFEISINPQAKVKIGDGTWISHDCHVCSYNQIDIGSQVLIGEFVSIRDSTHGAADSKVPIKKQKDILGSIIIEDDVWIGRGCLVQGKPEGVVIGHGAVIAANSVVSRSIPTMEVWGGVPARFIKRRDEKFSEAIVE